MLSSFLCRKITLILLIQTAFILAVNAQNRITQTDSSVVVHLRDKTILVQICTDNIIRILHSPTKSIQRDTSLVIRKTWGKISFDIEEEEDILLSTKKLQVMITENGSISVYNKSGEMLFTENPDDPAFFKPVKFLDENTYNAQLNIHFEKDEGVYGLGQYQNGIMNYRGDEVVLVQENTQVAIPFLLSTKKYALMFDNYSKIRFYDKNDSTYFWFEAADVIDYYFIAGDNLDEVIQGYRYATGEAPMLGKWAYGYWQSKERYKTQQELLSTAKEFRERKIPIDNIVQDWMYWGEDWAYWNSMSFNPEAYPDPKGMIDNVHKLNMHIMFSIWPVPGQLTELHQKLDSKGLLFDPFHWTDGRTYDAYSYEARQLYWNAVNNGLFSIGADAFWMDASEPEVFLAPNERSIKSVGKHSLGSIYKYFNTYSLLHTEGLYEGQRSVTDTKRVCIVTRSAFLGHQRNSATTWSGDIVADWDVYENQISAGLNFCMSGTPYWSNDIGGFHVKRYGAFPQLKDDLGYRELYVRWFQFGTFNPIFRSHGTDTPREPWQFGEPGTWAYDAILKYDHLRYRLMPYIYSLAWKITNDGYTIMRGLPMDFPEDKKVHEINDQFMFGPALLINPVTEHMYYGESYKNELIPAKNLRTVKGKSGGYNAQYFSGVNFDTLMVDSIQTELLFDMYLGKDMPPVVNWERNSIRWTGDFKTRDAGEYEFWLTTDDAIRFYVNNKKVIDQWNDKGIDSTYRSKINLEAEKWYSFKVEYARMANASKFRLAWRSPEMISKTYDPAAEAGTRKIYLPVVEHGWYDFWTGENFSGGKIIERKVPINIMPIYVKAGSIIPMGPMIQYVSEKKDPIELRIYPGADGEFILFDDEGDGYNYEKGVYAIVPINWNDKEQLLTIGDRKGNFPGMPEIIRFNIVWVDNNHGVGVEEVQNPDKSIVYTGKSARIKRK